MNSRSVPQFDRRALALQLVSVARASLDKYELGPHVAPHKPDPFQTNLQLLEEYIIHAIFRQLCYIQHCHRAATHQLFLAPAGQHS